jgi:hypothetical protein
MLLCLYDWKDLCSICGKSSESTAVSKECNIDRHYNSKFREKCKNCGDDLREQNMSALRGGGVEPQQNVLGNESNEDEGSTALRNCGFQLPHHTVQQHRKPP